MSRQELMRLCNEIMTSYEHDEGEMINKAKLANLTTAVDTTNDDTTTTTTTTTRHAPMMG
jgi:hypothetical protein